MAENEASRGGEAERIESGSWKVGTHVPNYSCARSPAWNGVLTLCGARARALPCALRAARAHGTSTLQAYLDSQNWPYDKHTDIQRPPKQSA